MIPDPQDTEGEQSAPLTNMDPGLDKFRQAFTGPESQQWADVVTTHLDNYYKQREIVQENQAASDAFVNNVARFRDGLSSAVTTDPLAAHTAFDIIQPTVAAVINAHPDHPEDQRQVAHDALVGDLQNHVAKAAITSAAEKHEGMARSLLGDPRIGGALSEEDKTGLGSYIDMQELARGADAQAQIQERQRLDAQVQARSTISRASALYDISTDKPNFPQGWASNLMSDHVTAPQDKADLMNLYGRMQTSGDIQRSDPFLVARAVEATVAGQPLSHSDLIRSAGIDLRLPDALWLASAGQHEDTDSLGYMSQVHAHIQAARDTYLREPSAAGAAAFGNFMNWFMPRARNGIDLNPQSPEYGLGVDPATVLHQFRPSGNDVMPAVAAERRPLSEIFGGKK